MNKINFQNLPNTTTPVNASNLNTMQSNIEIAIDTKAERTAFDLGAYASKVLSPSNVNNYLYLLAGKRSQGNAQFLWLVSGSGDGGTGRIKVNEIYTGASISSQINWTITDNVNITITNLTDGNYNMCIIPLIDKAKIRVQTPSS